MQSQVFNCCCSIQLFHISCSIPPVQFHLFNPAVQSQLFNPAVPLCSANFDINSCVRNSNNITLSLCDVLPCDSLPILLSSLTQQPHTPLQTCMEGAGQQGVLKEYKTLHRLACSISSPAHTAEVGRIATC